jgi:hypothetical protein
MAWEEIIRTEMAQATTKVGGSGTWIKAKVLKSSLRAHHIHAYFAYLLAG